jgi:hypothetical protein
MSSFAKTMARIGATYARAKRLECGAFTAAFARAALQQTNNDLRPLKSGAKATAFQTLARLLSKSLSAKTLELRLPSAGLFGHTRSSLTRI